MENKTEAYLTPERIIELSQRAIDKQEQAFESLRNRMYWMLTITTVALVPLVSMEHFEKIGAGWRIGIGLVGLFFLLIIILFYFWFVRPKETPTESPDKTYVNANPKANFIGDFLNHLIETKTKCENINNLASKRFFVLIIMMLATVVGVIIFVTTSGGI